MPLFLETYTIPHDLSVAELCRGLEREDRGTAVHVVRSAYNLTDGTVWCLCEADSMEQLKQAAWVMPFAFTLDRAVAVDPAWKESDRLPLPLDERVKLDGVIVAGSVQPVRRGSR